MEFELNHGFLRLVPKVGAFEFNELNLEITKGVNGTDAMGDFGFAPGTVQAAFGQDVTFYTRAGDFVLDVPNGPNGPLNLITSDGYRLQGVMGNPPAAMGPNTILEDIDLRAGLADGQQVTAYAIGLDGTVMRSVDGAQMEMVGRVAIASPANPEGLDAFGANLYSPTEASGITQFREAGSNGRGQIYQGYLENSNVDMAREFVDMIITQRGFQANSRTIGTSDEMLQELMNMKR